MPLKRKSQVMLSFSTKAKAHKSLAVLFRRGLFACKESVLSEELLVLDFLSFFQFPVTV